MLEVDGLKTIWDYLSKNAVSVFLLLSNVATYKLATRDKKAKITKTEGEVRKDQIEVQIKVDQYNNEKWDKMQITNETLNTEIRRMRTQLYASEQKRREEFDDMIEKLHSAEVLNIELTAEVNFYRTMVAKDKRYYA